MYWVDVFAKLLFWGLILRFFASWSGVLDYVLLIFSNDTSDSKITITELDN